MSADIRNEQSIVNIDVDFLKGLACKLLRILNLSKYELSVLILDNKSILKLNKKYLNKNEPTDVLAFGMEDSQDFRPKKRVLGDVVISAEMAKIRSQELNIDFNQELVLYLIHGVLHLLGYEDDTGTTRKKMERKQEELLEKLRNVT